MLSLPPETSFTLEFGVILLMRPLERPFPTYLNCLSTTLTFLMLEICPSWLEDPRLQALLVLCVCWRDRLEILMNFSLLERPFYYTTIILHSFNWWWLGDVGFKFNWWRYVHWGLIVPNKARHMFECAPLAWKFRGRMAERSPALHMFIKDVVGRHPKLYSDALCWDIRYHRVP